MTESSNLLRVGAVQTNPVFGDKQANQKEIEALIHGHEADLWVMPELALTGYEFKDRKEARELAEEIPDGESTQWLHKLCRDLNCHAVIGLAERDRDEVFNSCIIVGPDGLIGAYRKLHLFDREKLRFDPGARPLVVYDIGKARVGMMICYDWIYPEVARTLMLKGAQVIAHPTNLVMPYCQQSMRTRTLENRVFAVTANRVGREERDERVIKFTGRSQILSQLGDMLAFGDESHSSCLVAEINPAAADDKRVNPFNDLIADRRSEFYLADPERVRPGR
ncbi:acyltransferase [bacterium]|nr:acyltransferase [bacterium]MBU1920712.1 acyltransferase [bacterium]